MSQGYVYFISCQTSGETPVKVGYSGNHPSARLSNMQTGNPFKLELLGYLRGDQDLERRLHREYSEYRIAGEWFRLDGPVFYGMLDAAETLHQQEVAA